MMIKAADDYGNIIKYNLFDSKTWKALSRRRQDVLLLLL